jgi:hypothetical protein
MSTNDGWTGARDGGFRGLRISYCRQHGEAVPYRVKCPACALAAEVVRLQAESDRRCQECKRKGATG